MDYDIVVLDPRALATQPAPAADLSDVEIGRLRIDARRRLVLVDEVPLRMSAREFTLLHHLAAHPGVVFSRDALLRAVWGSAWRTEGSVTEYIRRLRIILEPTGLGECIVTRKGFGYSFDPDVVR
jgi:DNA-binding response OmpR family regulator